MKHHDGRTSLVLNEHEGPDGTVGDAHASRAYITHPTVRSSPTFRAHARGKRGNMAARKPVDKRTPEQVAYDDKVAAIIAAPTGAKIAALLGHTDNGRRVRGFTRGTLGVFVNGVEGRGDNARATLTEDDKAKIAEKFLGARP